MKAKGEKTHRQAGKRGLFPPYACPSRSGFVFRCLFECPLPFFTVHIYNPGRGEMGREYFQDFCSFVGRCWLCILWFVVFNHRFPLPADLASIHAEFNASFPIHGDRFATTRAINDDFSRVFCPVVIFGIRQGVFVFHAAPYSRLSLFFRSWFQSFALGKGRVIFKPGGATCCTWSASFSPSGSLSKARNTSPSATFCIAPRKRSS